MGVRINNNIEAMVAHRNLLKNDRAMSKSLERLASGQKVNRAADDPAALVISEHMRAEISGMQQAIRNNEVAISLVQTAEGSMNHVGPDAGHTAATSIRNMNTNQLGRPTNELNNSNFMSLADIDVSSEQGSMDALGIIDQAITEVATVRGELGAFQQHTLESNLTSLQVAAENMTSAESTLRDTDMAQELATFTRNQIMSQSATAQLAQANALPQNILRLLNA